MGDDGKTILFSPLLKKEERRGKEERIRYENVREITGKLSSGARAIAIFCEVKRKSNRGEEVIVFTGGGKGTLVSFLIHTPPPLSSPSSSLSSPSSSLSSLSLKREILGSHQHIIESHHHARVMCLATFSFPSWEEREKSEEKRERRERGCVVVAGMSTGDCILYQYGRERERKREGGKEREGGFSRLCILQFHKTTLLSFCTLSSSSGRKEEREEQEERGGWRGLVSGSADGQVAIWDISSILSLLFLSPSTVATEMPIFYPQITFKAHQCGANSLSSFSLPREKEEDKERGERERKSERFLIVSGGDDQRLSFCAIQKEKDEKEMRLLRWR